jgi:hypothetical protein
MKSTIPCRKPLEVGVFGRRPWDRDTNGDGQADIGSSASSLAGYGADT